MTESEEGDATVRLAAHRIEAATDICAIGGSQQPGQCEDTGAAVGIANGNSIDCGARLDGSEPICSSEPCVGGIVVDAP
jgi:hypothetical protein